MRSRNTRSFTVELKSKRRSTAAPMPPSIWGNAASLFRATPEPSNPTPVRTAVSPVSASPSVGIAPDAEKQARRVLPDLRVAESAPLEEALPIRVMRSNRKKGRTMSEKIERQGELPIGTAPAEPDETVRMVSTSAPQPVNLGAVEAESEDVLWEASAPASEVAQEPQTFVGSAPIVVPQKASRHEPRKWTRRVEDLPRGERWKRRLPEVCR